MLKTLDFVDSKSIGVIGFSLGAYVVNGLATTDMKNYIDKPEDHPKFKALVAFYGPCSALVYPDILNAPLKVIVGAKDGNAGMCKNAEYDKKGGHALTVDVIPDAYHGFDNQYASGRDPMGTVMQYDSRAATQAEKILAKFLKEQFGK